MLGATISSDKKSKYVPRSHSTNFYHATSLVYAVIQPFSSLLYQTRHDVFYRCTGVNSIENKHAELSKYAFISGKKLRYKENMMLEVILYSLILNSSRNCYKARLKARLILF